MGILKRMAFTLLILLILQSSNHGAASTAGHTTTSVDTQPENEKPIFIVKGGSKMIVYNDRIRMKFWKRAATVVLIILTTIFLLTCFLSLTFCF